MIAFGIVMYTCIGGVLCYAFKSQCGSHMFVDTTGDDYSTFLSVLTGALWPIVAPFSFAILFAKKKMK